MYDIIYNIIGHSWTSNTSEQSYIYYTCCALIILLTMVFIDMYGMSDITIVMTMSIVPKESSC